jgi:hypothetical protein
MVAMLYSAGIRFISSMAPDWSQVYVAASWSPNLEATDQARRMKLFEKLFPFRMHAGGFKKNAFLSK